MKFYFFPHFLFISSPQSCRYLFYSLDIALIFVVTGISHAYSYIHWNKTAIKAWFFRAFLIFWVLFFFFFKV